MAVTHGMNVEEVRRLGSQLKSVSEQINDIVRRLNAQVGSTSWVGPDASRFKDQVWPEHRSQLARVSGDLQSFGQTAMSNAAEQEQASGR